MDVLQLPQHTSCFKRWEREGNCLREKKLNESEWAYLDPLIKSNPNFIRAKKEAYIFTLIL